MFSIPNFTRSQVKDYKKSKTSNKLIQIESELTDYLLSICFNQADPAGSYNAIQNYTKNFVKSIKN